MRKLPAGHLLIATPGRIEVRRYWDLADSYTSDSAKGRSADELAAEVDSRIALGVNRRKRADVPVGVFLAGRIDSSTVLAHLAEQTGPP